MVDINRAARSYASRHPYEFTRLRLPDTQRDVSYRMRITEQPDPMIAIMLGDFIHNLRTALDYIVVACSIRQRQGNASFPVFFTDIFAKDDHGNFVVNDAEGRKSFESAVQGISPEARALVIGAQPYRYGAEAYREIIGIISRLENADKHRQIITVGGGVQDLIHRFFVRGDVVPLLHWQYLNIREFAKDNTVVGYTLPENSPAPDGSQVLASEVDMKFTGTAKILVKITGVRGNEPPSDFLLQTTMLDAMLVVRGFLRSMEPCVRR